MIFNRHKISIFFMLHLKFFDDLKPLLTDKNYKRNKKYKNCNHFPERHIDGTLCLTFKFKLNIQILTCAKLHQSQL